METTEITAKEKCIRNEKRRWRKSTGLCFTPQTETVFGSPQGENGIEFCHAINNDKLFSIRALE